MNIGLIPAGATAEKVKVASLIGLGDVVLMQFAVTALKPRSPLLPTRTPTSCFLIADVPVQPPGLDIQLDQIAIFDQHRSSYRSSASH